MLNGSFQKWFLEKPSRQKYFGDLGVEPPFPANTETVNWDLTETHWEDMRLLL